MHPWQECRPALVRLDETEARDSKSVAKAHTINTAMTAAWNAMSDDEHRMFHEFACLNQHDQAHFSVVQAFATSIERRLDAQQN